MKRAASTIFKVFGITQLRIKLTTSQSQHGCSTYWASVLDKTYLKLSLQYLSLNMNLWWLSLFRISSCGYRVSFFQTTINALSTKQICSRWLSKFYIIIFKRKKTWHFMWIFCTWKVKPHFLRKIQKKKKNCLLYGHWKTHKILSTCIYILYCSTLIFGVLHAGLPG